MNTPTEVPVGGEALSELARAVTSRGLPFRFEAKGGSMSPCLRSGDVLTIRRFAGPPRLGDIVAFCRPASGQLVVHRVIRTAGERVLTRGDALGFTDGWVPAECVLGRVASILRAGRPLRQCPRPACVLIALLSRAGVLVPLLLPLRILYRRFKARR